MPIQIDIITAFPGMFTGPFQESIINRAQQKNRATILVHDLRQYTKDSHKTIDDRPYGGGPGMVLMIEPIDKAIKDLKTDKTKVILTSAKGEQLSQSRARAYSQEEHLIIICGHYEGVDQRIVDHLIDEEISLGPYVLTGGEIPAMVITDAVVRLLPGVVGDPESIIEESHSQPGYKEYPHYTRPEIYQGWQVPEVLLSGNHAAIKKWRDENSG